MSTNFVPISISMDFVVGLSKTTKGSDVIRVVVERMTMSANFIPIKISYLFQEASRGLH